MEKVFTVTLTEEDFEQRLSKSEKKKFSMMSKEEKEKYMESFIELMEDIFQNEYFTMIFHEANSIIKGE